MKLGHILNSLDEKHVPQELPDVIQLVKQCRDDLLRCNIEATNPRILREMPGGKSVGLTLKDPCQIGRITSCFLDLGDTVGSLFFIQCQSSTESN